MPLLKEAVLVETVMTKAQRFREDEPVACEELVYGDSAKDS